MGKRRRARRQARKQERQTQRNAKKARKAARKQGRQARKQARKDDRRGKHHAKKVQRQHRRQEAVRKIGGFVSQTGKGIGKGATAVFKEVKADVIEPVKGVVASATRIGDAAANFGEAAATALPKAVDDLGEIGKTGAKGLAGGLSNLTNPIVMVPVV